MKTNDNTYRCTFVLRNGHLCKRGNVPNWQHGLCWQHWIFVYSWHEAIKKAITGKSLSQRIRETFDSELEAEQLRRKGFKAWRSKLDALRR